MTIPFMMNCSHQSDGWCLECLGEHYKEYESLRQQLADVIAERDRLRSRLEQLSQVLIDFTDRNADLCRELAMIEDERDRLRAELLQQPPTLEWLRETFGEPSCVYEKQAVWDELFIWDRRGSRVYHNASQDALTTRAAVLEAVAARKIESEGKQ